MDVIFALGEAGVQDPEDATKKKKAVKSISKESKPVDSESVKDVTESKPVDSNPLDSDSE